MSKSSGIKIKSFLSVLWAKYNHAKVALYCLFGITIFFIFSSTLSDLLGNYLKVHPSYTGGEIAGDFMNASDIARYTVHQPVTNARWQQSPEYWQVDIELKEKASAVPDITLYIDFEHEEIFVVKLSETGGKVFDSDGEYLCDTEMYFLDNQTIKTRIPLQNKKLQKVLGTKKTYHRVVSEELECPENVLEVSMENLVKKQNKKEIEELIQKVTTAYYSSAENKYESLEVYEQRYNENPEDYVNMAYYGSLIAMKGGESSVFKAMALVNKAYVYLDKAAELAFDKEGEIDVLLNRASVSAAVPQPVFGKAESGAEDFMRIIKLTEDPTLKAYCYVMAYKCYKKCDRETQALLALQEAQKMIE